MASIASDIWLSGTTSVATAIRDFLCACLSSGNALILAGPLFLIWSATALRCAAWLKRATGGRTGYSRKLFHLLTFAAAGSAHLSGGLPYVCALGLATTFVLAYAIARGAGHPLYEALARESDAPHRTYYIVTSYLATLAGGVVSNLIAGRLAFLGYLVCGLGDAAGEPVGTRWGRHWYAVPGPRGHGARRSVEGSAGVFVASVVALLGGVATLSSMSRAVQMSPQLLVMALLCTLAEALSPHGWDNATMQLAPSLLALMWLTECVA